MRTEPSALEFASGVGEPSANIAEQLAADGAINSNRTHSARLGRPEPRRVLRLVALAALPLALQIRPVLAIPLGVAIIALSPARRRLPHRLAIIGILTAALLSAALAPEPVPALVTWGTWVTMAAALAAVYTRVTHDDAGVLALGFAAAALAGAGLALWQVAWLGAAQAKAFAFHPNMAAAGFLTAVGGIFAGWQAWSGGTRWSATVNRAKMGRTLAIVVLTLGVLAGVVGLALTGSRSGVIGAAAGLLVAGLIAVPRLRPRLVAWIVMSVAMLLAALLGANRLVAGPVTRNLLTNSGFEHGLLPWVVGDGTERGQSARPESSGVKRQDSTELLLRRPTTATSRLVDYNAPLPINPGSPYAFSLLVQPAAGTKVNASLAIDAISGDGNLIARLGTDGWTPGSAQLTNGRPALPSQPSGAWQRWELAIPPVPEGAARLHLEIQASGSGIGSYGLIADAQLERGTAASSYVPGRRPGLGNLLQPVTSRLLALRDPEAAAGGRLGMWRLGIDLAAARPVLGYGPGSEGSLVDEYASARVRRPLFHFHSLYVKVLLEGGAVLAAALLTWLAITGRGLVAAALVGHPGANAAVATAVALLVESIFDPVLAQPTVLAGIWLVVCSISPGEEAHRLDPAP